MAIKNFLIECDVDGRSFFRAIPEGGDGEFRLEVSIQEDGKTVLPLVVTGRVLPDDQLQLVVDMAKDFTLDDTRDPNLMCLTVDR